MFAKHCQGPEDRSEFCQTSGIPHSDNVGYQEAKANSLSDLVRGGRCRVCRGCGVPLCSTAAEIS